MDDPGAWAAVITAAAGLVAAVTALVTAMRASTKAKAATARVVHLQTKVDGKTTVSEWRKPDMPA